MKYIVDIKGEIEGDYEIIGKYEERPQGEIKKYKPLELDYNVQCAVENLKTAYWSNELEKVAKKFTEAEDIIISAICHHGYTVCKQPQGEWIFTDDDYGFWHCNQCKAIGSPHNNYCPTCGADMRGDK